MQYQGVRVTMCVYKFHDLTGHAIGKCYRAFYVGALNVVEKQG